MSVTLEKWKKRCVVFGVLCALSVPAGCATTAPAPKRELPPVLTQEEVVRPYQKVAVLEVHRKRYGSPSDIKPEDYAWVYEALRQEACRIGADAVIFPEVRVELENYYLYPTSDMHGKGVAIKFQ